MLGEVWPADGPLPPALSEAEGSPLLRRPRLAGLVGAGYGLGMTLIGLALVQVLIADRGNVDVADVTARANAIGLAVGALASLGTGLTAWFVARRSLRADRREARAIAAVRLSNERTYAAFRNAPTGAAMVGVDGRITDINPALAAMLGRDRADLLGVHFGTVMEPEDLEAHLAWAQDAVRSVGSTLRREQQLVSADGRRFWVLMTSTLLRDLDRRPDCFVSQVIDVDETKRANDRLEASERFRRSILDSLASRTAVLDRDGRIVAVNAAWERGLDERVGTWQLAGIGTDYVAACVDAGRRGDGAALEAAAAIEVVLRGESDERRTEYEVREATGVRALALIVTPLATGDGAVVSHVDITWRVEAERQVAERARQQAAVAHLGQRALQLSGTRELIDAAIATAVDTLDADAGRVLRHDGDELRVMTDTRSGASDTDTRSGASDTDTRPGASPPPPSVVLSEGTLASAVLAGGEPVVVTDVRDEDRFELGMLAGDWSSGVFVFVPGDAGPFGLLMVTSAVPRGFTVDDVHFLESIASVLGSALERRRALKALRESEARFRFLSDDARDIVFLQRLTPTFGFEYLSPSAERILGYPLETLLADGAFAIDLIHPDDLDRVNDLLGAHEPVLGQIRLRHADGAWRWLEFHNVPLRDDDGELVAVHGIARDITEIKALDEQLRTRAEQQAAVAELGIQAASTPLQEFLVVAMRRMAETLGVDHASALELLPDGDELVVRGLHGFPTEWLHTKRVSADPDGSMAGRTVAGGEPVLLSDVDEWPEGLRHLAGHGIRSALSVIVPGRHRPHGSVAAFSSEPRAFSPDDVAFVQSVAALIASVVDRAWADHAIGEREDRLRLLAERAHDVVFRLRLQPAIELEYMSPSIERITGYPVDEHYARPTLGYDIAPAEDQPVLDAVRAGGFADDEPVIHRWIRRDGGVVWIEARNHTIRDDHGEAVAVEGIIRDVTDRVRDREEIAHKAAALEDANEQLQRAARLRDDFLAMASHELRTPLTPILGFTDLLRLRWEQLSEEDKLRFLDTIDRHANRMHHLVSDLLTMSQAQAGTLSGSPEPVCLRSQIEHVRATFPHRGADIRVEVPRDAAVSIDPRHLRQILANLLSNAATYGAPPIAVEVRPDGAHVELSVADAGSGVDDQLVPRLFERFEQRDRGDTRTSKGAGLGLAVCRELVHHNGGEIRYERRPRGGARFVVRLAASEMPSRPSRPIDAVASP